MELKIIGKLSDDHLFVFYYKHHAVQPQKSSLFFVYDPHLFKHPLLPVPSSNRQLFQPAGADVIKQHCQVIQLLTEAWHPMHRQLSLSLSLLLLLSASLLLIIVSY